MSRKNLLSFFGGVAGIYLAWRLVSVNDSEYDLSDIHLYEQVEKIFALPTSRLMEHPMWHTWQGLSLVVCM